MDYIMVYLCHTTMWDGDNRLARFKYVLIIIRTHRSVWCVSSEVESEVWEFRHRNGYEQKMNEMNLSLRCHENTLGGVREAHLREMLYIKRQASPSQYRQSYCKYYAKTRKQYLIMDFKCRVETNAFPGKSDGQWF